MICSGWRFFCIVVAAWVTWKTSWGTNERALQNITCRQLQRGLKKGVNLIYLKPSVREKKCLMEWNQGVTPVVSQRCRHRAAENQADGCRGLMRNLFWHKSFFSSSSLEGKRGDDCESVWDTVEAGLTCFLNEWVREAQGTNGFCFSSSEFPNHVIIALIIRVIAHVISDPFVITTPSTTPTMSTYNLSLWCCASAVRAQHRTHQHRTHHL